MINDLTLIQFIKNKSNLEKYGKYINKIALSRQGEIMYNDIVEYFSKFPEIEQINPEVFSDWFHHCKHLDFDKSTRELYNKFFFDNLNNPINVSGDELLKHYEKQAVFDKVIDLIKDNSDLDELEKIIVLGKSKEKVDSLYLSMDIEDIVNTETREQGLRWRMEFLNQKLGGILQGDFGVIAGVPNSGKTTFLISEVTHLASQLPPNKKVLWFNNEGPDYEIRNRIFQSALNKTVLELRLDYKEAYTKYIDLMGAQDKIQVIKAASQSYRNLEKIIMAEKENVGLIVFDMLDKIKGFDRFRTSETSDEKYDRAYEWALNLSILVAPVLGTSQTSYLEDAYQKRWPPMEALKGSRIAKQGDARFMIMIGKDDAEEGTIAPRFISSPKNKVGASIRQEVSIDKERARYLE